MESSSYAVKYSTVLGTDMTSVGRSPAYRPAVPSFLNMDTSVEMVPICPGVAVGPLLVIVAAGTSLVVVCSIAGIGKTHSMRPLLSMTVEPHSQHGRQPTLTPRNDVGSSMDDDSDDNDDNDVDDDDAGTRAVC